jgi:hypothetical protein
MKTFFKSKDGGAESTVTGYWLIEAKQWLSVAVLRFDGSSREAFHTHAFDCLNWVVSGSLTETLLDGTIRKYPASWCPFLIRREDFHRVDSDAPRTWVFTIRGPWRDTWREFLPAKNRFLTLTHGREEVT